MAARNSPRQKPSTSITKILVDSNILIIASKLRGVALLNFLRKREKELCVSMISKVEVLGYHKLRKLEKEYFERFFDATPVLNIDSPIATKAIKIRQKRQMALADALIAATAIEYNLPLFTENGKDFEFLKELTVISLNDVV